MKCPNCDGDLVEDSRDSTAYVCHCCYVALDINEVAQAWQIRCEQAETRANERANRARIVFRIAQDRLFRIKRAADTIQQWVLWYSEQERRAGERAARARILFRRLREAKFAIHGWVIRYNVMVKACEEAIQRRDEARAKLDQAQSWAKAWRNSAHFLRGLLHRRDSWLAEKLALRTKQRDELWQDLTASKADFVAIVSAYESIRFSHPFMASSLDIIKKSRAERDGSGDCLNKENHP